MKGSRARAFSCTTLFMPTLVLLVEYGASIARAEEAKAAAELPRTYVYECRDDYSFTVRLEDNQAWLFLPHQTVSLPHVRSGSGSRYSNGVVTFWGNGQQALIDNGERLYRDCTNNWALAIWEDAKLSGVDFRAVGNEPGWHLKIARGRDILFVTDYGATQYEFKTPAPLVDQQAHKTTYKVRADGHELVIVLQRKPCRDSMSGEAFETTATVTLNEKQYQGCGKALH